MKPEILARLLRGEKVVRRETTSLRRDGSRIAVSVAVSPIRDDTGRLIGAGALLHDLTARRRTEETLQKTEAELRHAQKMEAVGVLAGGIAHDFNNMLSVVLSYTSLLLEDVPPASTIHADLVQIDDAAKRAAGLTKQLLAFSRRQVLDPRDVDVTELLKGIATILRRVLGERIHLSLAFERGVGTVHVDPSQLEQVIMNLAVNARDAMPNGGSLTVTTRLVSGADEVTAHGNPRTLEGQLVVIEVVDTGCGMDAQTQARIFEPFFTTKEPGRGTGLGLSTSFGIVQQSGGFIDVKSTPGSGTTFKIFLPRRGASGRLARATPTGGLAPFGSETILLVEDNDAVRAATRSLLVRHGYKVLEAANAGEALLHSEQVAGTIHLLLTDVVMPLMNGRQLAERLRKDRPALPVLFVSANPEEILAGLNCETADTMFLAKPLTAQSLGQALRALLASVPP